VRDAERFVELDGKLPAFLKEEAKPVDAAEALLLAQLCHCKRSHAASVRFYTAAFALDRTLATDLKTTYRYNAACYAALAASGQGEDAPRDDRERQRLRRQSLDWLKAHFAAWNEMMGQEKFDGRPTVVSQMRHWQTDPDLAGVRDPESLDKLPDDERKAWRQLWADVEALRKRAAETK
jgi:hypothetical protein